MSTLREAFYDQYLCFLFLWPYVIIKAAKEKVKRREYKGDEFEKEGGRKQVTISQDTELFYLTNVI